MTMHFFAGNLEINKKTLLILILLKYHVGSYLGDTEKNTTELNA